MSNLSCRGNVLNYSDAIQTGRTRYELKMQAWTQIRHGQLISLSQGETVASGFRQSVGRGQMREAGAQLAVRLDQQTKVWRSGHV
jgi:hypothetical protein